MDEFKAIVNSYDDEKKGGSFLIGHLLEDQEVNWLHQFAPVGFRYPDFSRVFLLSKDLISGLKSATEDPHEARELKFRPKLFSMDAGFDLSQASNFLVSIVNLRFVCDN